jgi:hypothetical protein
MVMLQGFNNTWGATNVLCRRHNLHIEWNWKKNNVDRFVLPLVGVCLVVWELSLASGVGMVLGWVGPMRCPW